METSNSIPVFIPEIDLTQDYQNKTIYKITFVRVYNTNGQALTVPEILPTEIVMYEPSDKTISPPIFLKLVNDPL